MIVGSVHLWETFELIYVLEQMGYDGWYSLDIFPYREDGTAAVRQSLDMVKTLVAAARRVDAGRVAELQKASDAAGMVEFLRKEILV